MACERGLCCPRLGRRYTPIVPAEPRGRPLRGAPAFLDPIDRQELAASPPEAFEQRQQYALLHDTVCQSYDLPSCIETGHVMYHKEGLEGATWDAVQVEVYFDIVIGAQQNFEDPYRMYLGGACHEGPLLIVPSELAAELIGQKTL